LALAAVLPLFVLAGGGAVVKGTDMLRDASAVSAGGKAAVGSVVARSSVSGGGPGTGDIEKMTVEYTVDGTRYRTRVTGDDPVGSDVRVRYDPADPGSPIVSSPDEHRIFAVLGILIGLALILGPSGLTAKLAREVWRDRKKPRGRES
jgi:hypothetical protein